MKKRTRFIYRQRGSVTVEAAVSVPLFILVVFSLIGLIRTVSIDHEIQTALNGTAMEAAQVITVLYCMGVDGSVTDSGIANGQGLDLVEKLSGFLSPTDLHAMGEAGDDTPPDQAVSLWDLYKNVTDFMDGEDESGLGGWVNRFLRLRMMKRLSASDPYHIVGGIEGLDFSRSQWLKD